MSQPNDAFQFIGYDPNPPKKQPGRKKWKNTPEIPVIAPPPANAADYRPRSQSLPLFHTASPTPAMSIPSPLSTTSPYSLPRSPTADFPQPPEDSPMPFHDSATFAPSPSLSPLDLTTPLPLQNAPSALGVTFSPLSPRILELRREESPRPPSPLSSVSSLSTLPLNALVHDIQLSDSPFLSPTPLSTALPQEKTPLQARLELQDLVDKARETPHPTGSKLHLSRWQRVHKVLECILDNFEAFGDFMEAFSVNFASGASDGRTTLHMDMLARWLGGKSRFGPAHFVQAIYGHRYSVPNPTAVHRDELSHAFNGECDPLELHWARIALSVWAIRLVARRCGKEVEGLGKDDPEHPEVRVHLQASVNERMREKRSTLTHEDVFHFSMQNTADVIKARAPACWFITEWMAATRKNGVVVVRKRRPHPFIQAVAISTFVLGRNKSANGYFQMHMACWLFASKTHTNVKRIMSSLALSVHDTTARKGLISMGAQRLGKLRADTAEALARKELFGRKTIDNVQQYQPVHEPGVGKKPELITGTAATVLRLDNCRPGAFDLETYQQQFIQNNRRELTPHMLWKDIDFSHLHRVYCLHLVRILCEYIPSLQIYLPQILAKFRSAPIAKQPTRPISKTGIIPLGSNGYPEMEVHGMKEAERDFDRQMGLIPEEVSAANVLIWEAGDVGSVLSGGRVMRNLLSQAFSLNIYDSWENRLWTPGLFHVQMHMVNAIATNCYGPATTSDPSALSHSAAATNLHIPPKATNCHFYSTSKTMGTIFEAQVLDLWDLHHTGHTGLLPHFELLESHSKLPALDELELEAGTLVDRYMSRAAFECALSKSELDDSPELYKFKSADIPWSRRTETSAPTAGQPLSGSTGYAEIEGFTGDRPLANSILFRHDYLFFVELSDAISEGDVDRIVEVIKVWIFSFAGASKHNYSTVLFELYCLFRYDASPDLKDAIYKNWLVNKTGEQGKYMPDDQLQEHHNRWLEDMVSKHGGSFDDNFFRNMISPNVHFFLELKEQFDAAFDLSKRGMAHTSQSRAPEIGMLMNTYKETKLHYFCSGRSLGHATKDLFDLGFQALSNGKMEDLLNNATERATLLADVLKRRNNPHAPISTPAPNHDTDSRRACTPSNGEDEEPLERERPCGGSDWVFHIDQPGECTGGESETDGEDADEHVYDADVDREGWAMENDEE